MVAISLHTSGKESIDWIKSLVSRACWSQRVSRPGKAWTAGGLRVLELDRAVPE